MNDENNIYDYVISQINQLLKRGIDYYDLKDLDKQNKLITIYDYINNDSDAEIVIETPLKKKKTYPISGMSTGVRQATSYSSFLAMLNLEDFNTIDVNDPSSYMVTSPLKAGTNIGNSTMINDKMNIYDNNKRNE